MLVYLAKIYDDQDGEVHQLKDLVFRICLRDGSILVTYANQPVSQRYSLSRQVSLHLFLVG